MGRGRDRDLYISTHAIDRLRQRSHQLLHLPDALLRQLLRQLVLEVAPSGWRPVWDLQEQPAVVATLELNPLYAAGDVGVVCRPDTHNPDRPAVVTVLPTEVIANMSDRPLGHRPFAGLKLEPSAMAPTPTPTPTRSELPEAQAPAQAQAQPIEDLLTSTSHPYWVWVVGALPTPCKTRDEALARVNTAINAGQAVRLFRLLDLQALTKEKP